MAKTMLMAPSVLRRLFTPIFGGLGRSQASHLFLAFPKGLEPCAAFLRNEDDGSQRDEGETALTGVGVQSIYLGMPGFE